jgi:hypothetical protein
MGGTPDIGGMVCGKVFHIPATIPGLGFQSGQTSYPSILLKLYSVGNKEGQCQLPVGPIRVVSGSS